MNGAPNVAPSPPPKGDLTGPAFALDLPEPTVLRAGAVTDANSPLLSALRAEHDATLIAVSSRSSTVHFAHAAVFTLVGLIAAGTAGKLWYDAEPLFVDAAVPVGALALAGLVYALVRAVLGRRALRLELAAYAKLQHLRKELGLDDPRAMLP